MANDIEDFSIYRLNTTTKFNLSITTKHKYPNVNPFWVKLILELVVTAFYYHTQACTNNFILSSLDSDFLQYFDN